jgi:alpha-ketoglutarate-dependent taurine dioxygenase
MPAISVKKVGDALGAEISGVDLSTPIAADTFAAIRKAWRFSRLRASSSPMSCAPT